MALSFTGAGVTTGTTGTTSQAVTTATALAVGDYLVFLMAYDNTGGGGADPVSGTLTAAPATGAVGAAASTQTGLNDPGSASAGLACRCIAWPVTTAIPSGTSITFSWSGSAVTRSVALGKVTSAAVTGYRTNSGATGVIASNVNVANAAALVTPSVNNTELVLCWACEENSVAIGGDADTTNGSWGSIYGTQQGSGVAGMAVGMQAKVVTATATQSFSATGNATLSDWITGCLIFTETPVPAITQASYRIYDDGTETGAVALAAQDTAANGDITFGDGIGQLRVRLQSTNAGVLNATDDYQLQWEKNTSGTWVNVGTGDVLGYASANITEGQATTNRLGAGTGSFVAGKAAEDGLVDNLSWTSNNYTELLYTVAIVKANVTAGDVIKFRVLYNGATTGMTYTVTPQVNVLQSQATQAAYRFYADGTETGSVALAAQDTAASGDITAGDANVLLRVRLQSTSAIALPATDDWQLQYEKNSSGTWANIGAAGGGTLADSYSEVNADAVASLGSGTVAGLGQSFLGDGKALSGAEFWLSRLGSPTFSVVAKLYAHTGTFGGSGTATGSALAVSTTTIAASAVGTSASWQVFAFDGSVVLTNGVPYVVMVEVNTYVGDSANELRAGRDITAPTHAGANQYIDNSAVFGAIATIDCCFRVSTTTPVSTVAPFASANLTDGAATTNRLTGGTGSFTAGEVSETGLASDLGWSGNNYTEMLYSISLKAADLVNGDVLKFRVLRNGVTTTMTYTAVPQINVAVVAGIPHVANIFNQAALTRMTRF